MVDDISRTSSLSGATSSFSIFAITASFDTLFFATGFFFGAVFFATGAVFGVDAGAFLGATFLAGAAAFFAGAFLEEGVFFGEDGAIRK